MTIRGRIFALTYDRLMAKTEDAGLAAHRAGLPPSARSTTSAGPRASCGGCFDPTVGL